MEAPKQSTARDLAIIAGLLAVLVVPSLFARDLWNPDEPRYTEVAREMVVMRQFLVPHLNGEIYPDKPPLFFWAAALLWKLGLGVNAGRILSALCCLGTLWAVYLFTRRFLPAIPPLLASLATLSTLMFTISATEGVIDPVLTMLVTGALMCGYVALHGEPGRRTPWWLGAYALAALGVLTKGPVGFLVPALVLLAYGLLNRERVKGGGRAHAWGALLFAAIVLGWLVPAALTGGPEYARTILIKQNLGRTVRSYSHRNPFHYFLLRLPGHYFPWALLLPFAAWAALRRRGAARDNAALFAAVWVLVCVGFFSLISGKRIGYILPTAPALGMLGAWYVSAQAGDEGRRRAVVLWVHRLAFGVLLLVAGALIGAAALARPILVRIEENEELLNEALRAVTPAWQVCAAAALMLPLALACVGLAQAAAKGRSRPALLAVATLALVATTLPIVWPVVNIFKSGKLFCEAAMPYVSRADVVHLYPQDYSGVYNLYTGLVHMPVIRDEAPLREALARPGTVVIGRRKNLLKALTPDELAGWTLMRRNVGHREMVLLGASAPEATGER